MVEVVEVVEGAFEEVEDRGVDVEIGVDVEVTMTVVSETGVDEAGGVIELTDVEDIEVVETGGVAPVGVTSSFVFVTFVDIVKMRSNLCLPSRLRFAMLAETN